MGRVTVVGLSDAKAKLSSIIDDVVHKGDTVLIQRRGRKVAAIVPFEKFRKGRVSKKENGGLLAAAGALADVDSEIINKFVEHVYEARTKAVDRKVDF